MHYLWEESKSLDGMYTVTERPGRDEDVGFITTISPSNELGKTMAVRTQPPGHINPTIPVYLSSTYIQCEGWEDFKL